METIQGKTPIELNQAELQMRLEGYKQIHLDLGTGDGRFIRCMAEQHPRSFFIGVDACRENLRANSSRKLPNALFAIASAQSLPQELNGLISHITINFPWGSLLESLLENDPALIGGLASITRHCSNMDIHLNADALVTADWTLESGTNQIERTLNSAGWRTHLRSYLDAHNLRSFPTTWAKRLAFGRDPRAIQVRVQRE